MRILLILPVLMLAACDKPTWSRDDGPAPAPSPAATPDAEAPETTAANPPGSTLPPADADPRYVGRWAAEAGMCADRAWRFEKDGFSTPAGSVCTFDDVTAVPGGYDIAARCTAEAPEAEDRITLRFAESARAMTVDANTVAGTGLVYCGA